MLALSRTVLSAGRAFFGAAGLLVSAQVWAQAPAPCPVELELDASHAALLIEILADDEITTTEVAAFIGHPVTEDVLQKTRSYGIEVDSDMLVAQLRQVAAGQEISDRSFGLARYESRRHNTHDLVRRLDEEFPAMLKSVCDRLAPYVPEGQRFEQTVVVLSAVNSSGFTFDDPSRIYLVAEAFDGDFGGLADLVVHESYHAIQSVLIEGNRLFSDDTGLAPKANSTMRLLSGTILEGTATHIADPIEVGKEGAMRSFQYRLAQRYRRDMAHQFTLFDTVLFRAFGDTEVDYYTLHRIGLEGNEAFYHVGALMTKTIADADGPGSIASYFAKSPVAFFKRYAILSSEREDLPKFSKSTLDTLEALGDLESGSRQAWSVPDAGTSSVQILFKQVISLPGSR